jgi:chromosome segregation ATPase
MPPRLGQLDEISQAIGQLEGRFDGIERYMHDREHGLNNVSQKLDAISTKFSGDIAAAKAEINGSMTTAIERVEARIQTIDDRVAALETARSKNEGAKSVWIEILKSPIVAGTIGGILAAFAMAYAFFTGKHP